MCSMEFEILGETEDWLALKEEQRGVEYLGELVTPLSKSQYCF